MLCHEAPFYTTLRKEDIIESRIRSGLHKYYSKFITNDIAFMCIVHSAGYIHCCQPRLIEAAYSMMTKIVEDSR
jgi:hypothetical protein